MGFAECGVCKIRKMNGSGIPCSPLDLFLSFSSPEAQPHARTKPARGLGKVFPGSGTDGLHFLCCLYATSLGLVKLGRGLKKNAGHS